jgi:NAD(P)-dependent dehydrogenase (short-subunit alcohol dehydrogenase family)
MVEALGRHCLAIVGDVREVADLEGAVARAHSELGKVDIAVCNAGLAPQLHVLADVDPGLWQHTIDINLTGVYNTIRAVLPGMVDRHYGRIVATSSMAGRGGFAHAGPYCASKWGVIGLIKVVANEYAMHGITANAVCPTNVNSPMIHNPDTYQVFVPDVENPSKELAMERMAAIHPMGIPYVEPHDISQAILFLVSEEARYVSGDALTVSAGSAARNSA